MSRLINIWRNLIQCSTCEQLRDQIDMLRRDHDLRRSDFIVEINRLLARIEVLESKYQPAGQPDSQDNTSLDKYEPIKGVSNPRRAIINLQRQINKTHKQKIDDAGEIS